MPRKTNARWTLFACALAVVGGALVLRYQRPLERRLFARRLAQDLPPAEGVKAARALQAIDDDGSAAQALEGGARLRYLLATGFSLADLSRRALARRGAGESDQAVLARLEVRERELATEAGRLTAALPELAERWFAEAAELAVRRRAAYALGIGGRPEALATLGGAFGAGADPGLCVAAFTAGTSILARHPDADARVRFLTAAVRVPALASRAIEAFDLSTDASAIPVLLAYLETARGAPDAERKSTTSALRNLAGPARAASAPSGLDPSEWRAWWDRVKDR